MPLKFCTESDPDTNQSGSSAVPVEAVGTSLRLCSCYYIMRLKLLMKNWKVWTGRAAASAGSNKESIWASLSSQRVLKVRQRLWQAVQSYKATSTVWQHLCGRRAAGPQTYAAMPGISAFCNPPRFVFALCSQIRAKQMGWGWSPRVPSNTGYSFGWQNIACFSFRESTDREAPTISHYGCFLVIFPLKDHSSVITFEVFPYKIVTTKSVIVHICLCRGLQIKWK